MTIVAGRDRISLSLNSSAGLSWNEEHSFVYNNVMFFFHSSHSFAPLVILYHVFPSSCTAAAVVKAGSVLASTFKYDCRKPNRNLYLQVCD